MLDLEGLSLYTNHTFNKIFFVIGLLWALVKLIKWSIIGLKYMTRFEKDLIGRYGENSYVFITGASDGIGRSLAFSFASRGFNLVLVARNKQKTEQVKEAILKNFPNVKVRLVLADFQFSMKETFYSDIMDAVKDLDISILVNNVGVIYKNYFSKHKENEIKETILINTIPQAILSRYFIPLMNTRAKKSAIITLSSLSSEVTQPGLAVYAATKSFNNHLSDGLSVENPNIDFLSLKPSYIKSNMTTEIKSRMLIDTDDFAESVFKLIGNTDSSYGHISHQFFGTIIASIPKPIIKFMLSSKSKKKKSSSPAENKEKKTN